MIRHLKSYKTINKFDTEGPVPSERLFVKEEIDSITACKWLIKTCKTERCKNPSDE